MSNSTRNNSSVNSEENVIDLGVLFVDMFKGLRRWWGTFLILISIFASIAYFAARLTYAPYYTAYSTFTVNTSSSISYNSRGQKNNVTRQIGEIFPSILTSDALNSLVMEDLGYDDEENPMRATIDATVIEDTNLVTLLVSSKDPQTAYDVLESVLRNYPAISERAIGEVELKVMDESGVPIKPANPPAFRKAALIGVAIGALLCVLWLVLYALTKRTVRSEEDLKKYFNLEYLGSIPLAVFKKRKKGAENQITVDTKGIPSSFVEAVRTMRHRVEKIAEENPDQIKTIIVTSALQSEGKTTISTNLAIALANRRHRVLLIDGDLRNPSVGPAMGLEPQEFGAADLFKGNCTIEDVLVQYKKMKRLQVIPGGQPVMNPTSLWGQEETEEIIKGLRRLYDYVIVDAPPSAIVSDTSLIARYMDGCVFVVRQDFARIDMLRDGMEMFSGTGCKLIGCVLNHAEGEFGGYGYGGYGYGRYGYGGYGYGARKSYGYGYGYGYESTVLGADAENEAEERTDINLEENSETETGAGEESVSGISEVSS